MNFISSAAELDGQARVAKFSRDIHGSRIRGLSHPCDENREARLLRQFAGFLYGEDGAIGADGEADAFCWRAAEEFYQAVVAAAAADGVLRAQAWGYDFEGGACVIVQAANEAPVFFVGDAAQAQFLFQFGEMLAARVAKMIRDARQL